MLWELELWSYRFNGSGGGGSGGSLAGSLSWVVLGLGFGCHTRAVFVVGFKLLFS